MRIAPVGGITYSVKSGKKMKAEQTFYNKDCSWLIQKDGKFICGYTTFELNKKRDCSKCKQFAK